MTNRQLGPQHAAVSDKAVTNSPTMTGDQRRLAEQETLTKTGASEWLRPSYGRLQPEAPARGGEGRPVMPRARAHAASPAQYREGAALGEEKPDTAASRVAVSVQSAAPRALRATEIAAQRRKPKRRTRDAANLKNDKITVRFNPDEAAALRRRAGELGISVSAHIACKALAEDGGVTVSRDEQLDAAVEELAALRPQVAGIGRNINQIVRQVNMDVGLEPGPVRDAFIAATELLGAARAVVADIDRSAMRLAKAERR